MEIVPSKYIEPVRSTLAEYAKAFCLCLHTICRHARLKFLWIKTRSVSYFYIYMNLCQYWWHRKKSPSTVKILPYTEHLICLVYEDFYLSIGFTFYSAIKLRCKCGFLLDFQVRANVINICLSLENKAPYL